MTEFPFLPHPHRDETVAAADPGPGAPEPAPGFGIGGEEPDVTGDGQRARTEAGAADGDPATDEDPPFRTPDPGTVGPA